MNETHDTIKGLLAEFRGYSAGMPASYHVTMSWADFRKMLTRFEAAHDHDIATATEASARAVVGACVKQQEAAHKRERGNSAALREALEAAELGLFWWQSGSMNRDKHRALIAKIKTALAEPPRNCDIYLTEEAVDAATVTVRDCEACSRIDMEAPCVFCMVRWLLAPAQEKDGGAK